MKIEQRRWMQPTGWETAPTAAKPADAQLVLVFGATAVLHRAELMGQLQESYPGARLLGCSTAGEICGTRVTDDSLVTTAIQLEHTKIWIEQADLAQTPDSFAAGEGLARRLPAALPPGGSGEMEKLTHVLVLSDGLKVNGSDLVRGLTKHLPADVTVTGGLAGDGARFTETLVFRDNAPARDTVAALGFYGPHFKVGFGSLGGWDSFGPERLITRSKGNVLFELDGRSALGLYKQYLGEHAKQLPASGLLFPLSLRSNSGEASVVRTILSVDEKAGSITFAGDVPEGAYARLMKANFDRLIDGATGAARRSEQALGAGRAELALLISCVGRKLVLKQRIEEEVEAVRDVLGAGPVLTGFYSYGEISPFTPGAKCELHNQTMTITTLAEE